jgi:hypothetical protein
MLIRSLVSFVYCEAYTVRNKRKFVKNYYRKMNKEPIGGVSAPISLHRVDVGAVDDVSKVCVCSMFKVEVNVHEDFAGRFGTSARSGIGKLNQGLPSYGPLNAAPRLRPSSHMSVLPEPTCT